MARRARNGDQEALGALAERMRVSLFGLAFAELGNYEDAQDAVAEALLRICQHIGDLREPERMRQWSHGIARNEARRIAATRRKGGWLPLGVKGGWLPLGVEGEILGSRTARVTPADTTAGDVATRLQRLDIRLALGRLPAAHAEAVRLHYLSGFSIDEIARGSGSPSGTVKSWLHHARRRLALEMEAYAPMMTSPQTVTSPASSDHAAAQSAETTAGPPAKRDALLLQTEMEPALVDALTGALRAGGFSSVAVPSEEEIRGIVAAANASDFATVEAWLAPYSLFLLDEVIAGQPALMYLGNVKAYPVTRNVPVGVLLDGPPSAFAAAAYYGAGARRLVDKRDPDEWALLTNFERLWGAPWAAFTERALRVFRLAQEEAQRMNDQYVSTEHVLLGLTGVPESVGARLLAEKIPLPLSQVREAVLREAAPGQGYDPGGAMQLTPRAKQAIDLAYDEARLLGNRYLGAEHLLLGLLRETDGLGGRALRLLGVELERTRELVREWQSG